LIKTDSFPRPLLSIILVTVGLAGWYLSADSDKISLQRDKPPHVPGYFVRNLSMVSMGMDGRPDKQLETIRLVQFLDDETTEMTAPEYQFFKPGQPPWRVKAEQGWLSADGELALLSGRVTILRPADATTVPFKLVTSDLRIQPDNNYLETDNAVQASSGKDRIDAVGMQAWLGEPARIKFLSNVRATYVPR